MRLRSQKKIHQRSTGNVFQKALPLCCIGMSTSAIRKKLFDSTGLFDESLPCCEDYDFWLRATAQHPVILIPEALTIKQGGHSDQLSRKFPAMDTFRIYAIDKLLKSNILNSDQRKAAIKQLHKKCNIYIPIF